MRSERRILDQAIAVHQKGDAARAAPLYRAIVAANPANLEAVHYLGVAEAALGRVQEARSLLDRSLQSKPVNIQYLENYVAILQQARDHDSIIALCKRYLPALPGNRTLLHSLAAASLARNMLDEAASTARELAARNPSYVPGHVMLGSALARSGHDREALAAFDRALKLNSHIVEAHLDKGTLHFSRRRFDEALKCYDDAIARRQDSAPAWCGRGYALIQLGRYQDALDSMNRALSFAPESSDALVGKGNALIELRLFDESTTTFDHVTKLYPGSTGGYNGMGNAMLRAGEQDKALTHFDKAISCDARSADAWTGRGTALTMLGRHRDAADALDKSLSVNSDSAAAWSVRGQIHYLQREYEGALRVWTESLRLDPTQAGIAAARLRVKMHLCDWKDYDAECRAVDRSVHDGHVVSPFMYVSLPSSPEDQLRCARRWVALNFGAGKLPESSHVAAPGARIRLAYLSADFHDHATAHLMAGVFEHHDRTAFEITALSVGPDDQSSTRKRLLSAFEHFSDLRGRSDREIADFVRAKNIDILVDLKGYMQDARTAVLAMRPAPIQVNYLGFPGTLGADFIDYIIADRHVVPESERRHYAEKVVWLPDTYQANDRNRIISDASTRRADHGLPPDAFVYCCFNDNYKITPPVFSRWMSILNKVERSVLWLFAENATASDNLRREAAERGISPARLVFAEKRPHADHLARHAHADLFLDTLPYGAHTTASDALWCNVPVLTQLGGTFAGRVAASLLQAIGLTELISTTGDQYEQLAVALAQEPDRLTAIKHKLIERRLTSPLFDTAQFTRNAEAAFRAMMDRHRSGLPPEHLAIDTRSSSAAVARAS